MIDETTTLIALLEWEIAAAQAREAELRAAVKVLLDSSLMKASTPQKNCTSSATTVVAKRHMARLRQLLAEPQDDKRLRQRLLSARYEAAAHSLCTAK